MNNHALLDIIGEVNEDYVLAADSSAARPRFRWQTLAACAACAALIVAAYPAWQGLSQKLTADSASGLDVPEASRAPIQRPGLHEYTLVEGGVAATGDAEAAAGGADGSAPESIALPDPVPGGEPAPYPEFNKAGEDFQPAAAPFADPSAGDVFADAAGGAESVPSPEEAALGILTIDQSTAIAQYQRLCRICGVDGTSPPAWYAGSWLDNDYSDRVARFTVSIVEGFHTPELEAQIVEWCGGGEVVFASDGKYSYAHLCKLKEQIFQELSDPGKETEWAGWTSMGTDVWGNCLNVDFSGAPSDEALAFLALLDPDGDAIHVWAYTGQTINPDVVKGPAPAEPIAEPSVPPSP